MKWQLGEAYGFTAPDGSLEHIMPEHLRTVQPEVLL